MNEDNQQSPWVPALLFLHPAKRQTSVSETETEKQNSRTEVHQSYQDVTTKTHCHSWYWSQHPRPTGTRRFHLSLHVKINIDKCLEFLSESIVDDTITQLDQEKSRNGGWKVKSPPPSPGIKATSVVADAGWGHLSHRHDAFTPRVMDKLEQLRR